MIHETILDEEEEKKVVKIPDVVGTSLFIFTEDNFCGLRTKAMKLVNNGKFDNIILTLIAISTINLAIETPFDDENGKKAHVL